MKEQWKNFTEVKIELAPVTGKPVSFYRRHAQIELDGAIANMLLPMADAFVTDLDKKDIWVVANELNEQYYYWTLADFSAFARLASRGQLKKQIDYVTYGDVKFKLTKPLIFEMAHVYDIDRQNKIDQFRTSGKKKTPEQIADEKEQEAKLFQLYQDIKNGVKEPPKPLTDWKQKIKEDEYNYQLFKRDYEARKERGIDGF